MKEFRKHNSKKGGGHPAYIYRKEGDKYIYIGLTHSPISQGVKNVKLNVNPNPDDSKDQYAKPKPDKDKKSTFGKREKGWKFDFSDEEIIEKIKKNED